MLLIIKELGSELLKMADEDEKEILNEFFAIVDSMNLDVEDSIVNTIIEKIKKDPIERQKVAELVYPFLKEMIMQAKLEWLAKRGLS